MGPDRDVICKTLLAMLSEKLNLDVASYETELLQTGILDSMTLVELFVLIEQEFGVTISIETLEIDHFQSVNTIAQFVMASRSSIR